MAQIKLVCNLRKIMKERNLTIQDLKDQTSLSRTTISNLCNGYSTGIQFDTLEQLINVLRCTFNELFSIPHPNNINKLEKEPMMQHSTLGQRIKTARLRANMTLVDLADRTELTQGYLSNLENEKRKPSIEVLAKLAEVLNEPQLANLISESLSEPNSITVGQRIKIARKVLGKSVTTLAKATGYSRPYLSLVENGDRKPNIKVLKAVADALGNVSFQELLMLAGYSELLPDDAYEQTPRFIDLSDICNARTMQLSDNEIQYNGHPLTTDEVNRVLQVLEAMFPEYRERG